MKKTILKVVSVIIIAVLPSAAIISCGPQEEPSIPVPGVSISKTFRKRQWCRKRLFH